MIFIITSFDNLQKNKIIRNIAEMFDLSTKLFGENGHTMSNKYLLPVAYLSDLLVKLLGENGYTMLNKYLLSVAYLSDLSAKLLDLLVLLMSVLKSVM